MKAPTSMLPTYVVSDVHLGCSETGTVSNREASLISFFNSLQGSASQLIICGDFFEFWMEYTDFVPKNHFGVLCALNNLVNSGTDVHYIAGNHDFNLGTFFDTHLKVTAHSDAYTFESGSKKIYMTHGDGLAQSDWKYRIAKKIIRSPLNNFLFKLLHPDWGMALARFVGSTSRYAGSGKKVDLLEYQKAAFSILRREHCDVFIQGHTHHKKIAKQDELLFVNCGDWLFEMSYLKITDGVVEQLDYTTAPT